MAIGLIGMKIGMTRLFDENGQSIPVTVVKVDPNYVTQINTEEKEGYQAIQITTGKIKPAKVDKPSAGHYANAKVEAGRGLWEFRLGSTDKTDITLGQAFTVDFFHDGQYVDVTGITKGKGYAGVIKRHHFASQDATHGNSLSHRAPGSIGQRQTPGRVFKGKRMAGHLGCERCTTQNLKIVSVDKSRQLLLIKGAIPGATGGNIIVKPAVKKQQLGEDNAA